MAFALALLTALTLAACASIPDTGPVVSGDVINNDPLDGVFQLAPEGPKAGQSPTEVVKGFLAASAGYSDDHAVARSFLSPQVRLNWRPDASVTVYRSLDQLTARQLSNGAEVPEETTPEASQSAAAGVAGAAGGSTDAPGVSTQADAAVGAAAAAGADANQEVTEVVVRTPVIARIDGEGRYSVVAPGTKSEVRYYGLVRIDGQWRINSLDDGILITRNDFSVTFKSYAVYYPDPQGEYLVPDTHWFPSSPGSPELPTALVRALLEGPPDWLADAVATSVPEGTEMAVSAVVVDEGVATVDLTSAARLADDEERQLLLAQLEATLGQLGTISSVRVTVDRVTYNIPQESGPQPTLDPSVGGSAVGLDSKGRIVRIGSDGNDVVEGLDELDGYDASYGLIAPGVSYDGAWYAALSADRTRLFLSQAEPDTLVQIRGNALTAPSFDPLGWVWTAGSSGVTALQADAAASDHARVQVAADWLEDYDVTAMRVSRDGTRAVLAVDDGGDPRVLLTGIVRDDSGRPVRLTRPTDVLSDLTSVKDVTWVGDDRIAVLGRRLSGAANAADEEVSAKVDRPWIVDLGGTVQPLATVPGARTITAGDGSSSLLAGTASETQRRSGSSWGLYSTTRWPAYPG